jgi:phosphoglycolate phosphatase-like HAD superfamily hydrolase
LFSFTPQHDYLVAIDSDGCTFDTMEVKHKECFIPCFINHYNLQAVSRFARECWEFVNLYSRSRGVNRFPALIETLQWLQRRPEVAARGVQIEIPESLQAWVKSETRLGNPALEARVKETNDPALAHCLVWSKAVNKAIDDLVRHVPPFPFVRESLQKLQGQTDLVVCSATPSEALKKEWCEHQIDSYVSEICGQEQGTKKELLVQARQYPPHHALMVGDALGDYNAAQANACLFFPINPGAEDAAWERFHREGIARFLNGQFAGQYQDSLLTGFRAYLPEQPSWNVTY